MTNITQLALELCADGVPTNEKINAELWDKYCDKLSNDERALVFSLYSYSEVYYAVKAGDISKDTIEHSFHSLFERDGTVKSHVLHTLDTETLKEDYNALYEKNRLEHQEKVASRAALIEQEMAHAKAVLTALNMRMSKNELSYNIEDDRDTNDMAVSLYDHTIGELHYFTVEKHE